jgi:hypothetical protein
VELSGSLNVRVTCVPEKVTVETVGGVKSGWLFEILVTATLESETPSLPDKSCSAGFVVNPLGIGAAYETETISPETMLVPTVSTTVEPLIETAVGLNVMPFKVIE